MSSQKNIQNSQSDTGQNCDQDQADQNSRADSDDPPLLETITPDDRLDLRILQAIRRIIRSVELYSRKLALGHGITAPQLICLLKIGERQDITAKELAGQVYLSSSTIVGILDRLEAKNLITRERSKVDRRQIHLKLTDQGESLAQAAPSPLQDALSKALEQLPHLERLAIALSLERVVELMEIDRVDASPILETGPTLEPLHDTGTSEV